MDLNRRNTLAAMGGLALAGGGILGSGAFTTVSADRTVNVNVIANTELGDSENFADVLIDVGGYDEVAVKQSNGSLNTDGSGLFPTSSDNYSTPDFGGQYVSLLQNDVQLVFGFDETGNGGNDTRLLANASVEFADLISLVNSNDSETVGEHSLSFDTSGFGVDGSNIAFASAPSNVKVGSEAADSRTVTVTAGSDDDTGATLKINITDPTA